ncbi:MAG: SPOR domain-containing protein [Erysipelotrichaceae bacterium]|nr:SPOR domain-containing protein [Erysipelotrichaceae bacterium]
MKRSFVTVMALSFTLIFSFVYMKVFVDDQAISTSTSSAIVYYLQVGVFGNEDNARKRIDQLKSDNVEAMYYVKQHMYYVITGISMDLQSKDDLKDVLSNKGYGSYDKQIVITDEVIISSIEQQSYDLLLEVMASK